MPACTLETLGAVVFACEIFLAVGSLVAVVLVPSVVGAACTGLLLACGLLGAFAAQTLDDVFALLRVFLALFLSVTIMFFVVPHVEELANELIDATVIPRISGDKASPAAKELRRTLHFGEDALLCVFVAMVCAGWILFSTVYWTHIRRGRVAERALRRFMKATPAIPYLEPLLDSAVGAGGGLARATRASPPDPHRSASGRDWRPLEPLVLLPGGVAAATVPAPSSATAMASPAGASAPAAAAAGASPASARAADGTASTRAGSASIAAGSADGDSSTPGAYVELAPAGADTPPAAARTRTSPADAADGAGGAARSDTAESVCAICLCAFEHGEPVRVLVCQHPFHKECIDRWVVSMQLAADCPLCKRQLMDDFI